MKLWQILCTVLSTSGVWSSAESKPTFYVWAVSGTEARRKAESVVGSTTVSGTAVAVEPHTLDLMMETYYSWDAIDDEWGQPEAPANDDE